MPLRVISRISPFRHFSLCACFYFAALATTGAVSIACAAEAASGKPATVAEATRAIDLSKFPLMPGVEIPGQRRIASLSYNAASTVAKAFEFQKQKLAAAKWKELPGTNVSEQAASGTFAREGFTLSISVFPVGKPGMVLVSLTNHGNVDVKKLPLPKDAKSLYAGPVSAAFVTAESVEKTTAAVNKSLTAQGWQPYGTAGDSQFFKQNAVRLMVRVSTAPAQAGKTVIDFSTEQLSVDIPAPAATLDLRYSDLTAQLLFDTSADKAEIFAFYRKALAAAGWEATTENPVSSNSRDWMIFRNPAKDLLEVETYTVNEKLRVTAKQQSAAEIAELDKRAQAEIARKKMEEEKARSKREAKVAVKLPAEAKDVKQKNGQIEFTLEAGKAKAAVEELRKQFAKAGWKEEQATLKDKAGTLHFTGEEKRITMIYIDTGFMPAEITIRGPGVEAEESQSEE